jgi:hypothetical protein
MKTNDAERIWPVLLLSIGFALNGTGTTLLDCILPALSASWRMNDARAGISFAAQFSGSAFGRIVKKFAQPSDAWVFATISPERGTVLRINDWWEVSSDMPNRLLSARVTLRRDTSPAGAHAPATIHR